MSIDELDELRNSNEAPFDHQDYTIWLHNKIIDKINYELWNLREQKGTKINSGYAMCNHVMTMESLKKAE
jgi:hypothetical protein